MRVVEYGLLLLLVGLMVFFVADFVGSVSDSLHNSAGMIERATDGGKP